MVYLSTWRHKLLTLDPKPFGFFAILVNFWGLQNFTANHSSASVKYEKHDEMQFELSWIQFFEGQPPTIEWSIFLPGGTNFSFWTLFWKHYEGPTWMHIPRFRF